MLTSRQRDLLVFIKGYIDANGGVSPSIVEMQAALGLKSKSGIVRFLSRLEERGFIRRRRRNARSVEVMRMPGAFDPMLALTSAATHLEEAAGTEIAVAALTDLARDMLLKHALGRRSAAWEVEAGTA